MKLKRFSKHPIVLTPLIAMSAVLGTTSAQEIDWQAELGDYEGQTLRIIMIQDPWVGAFDTINQEFTELTGADVIIDSYSYDQTYEQEVRLGTSKGDQYDVVVLDSPWVGQFGEGGFVEDLTPYIEKDADIVQYEDFVTPFQEVARWKGEVVGIPFGAYFVLNHYRTDLFEQAGLEPIETIEDFRTAAETLTNIQPGVFGTALNNQRGAPVGQAWFEYIYNFGGKPFESMYKGSPDPYADMTPLIDSPESIEVVNFFREMLQFEPPGAENFAWDERATTFSVGRTGTINAWSVRTPGFANPEQSTVVDTFATTLFPHKEGVEPAPPLGGWVMGINPASGNKDLAWDYIKWFTSQETHKKFVLNGGPPSRLSTLQDPEIQEAVPWADTVFQSQELAYSEARPRIPEAFEIIDTIGLYVSRAVLGEMSVEEAMAKADQEVGDLLKRNGYTVNQ